MAPVVGRFAPTPSGYLHLGNLFCSLIAWLSAKSQGGEILFRSEDLDPDRSRSTYALQAQRDLEALGLFWDREENCQSRRFDFYKSQLRRLEDRGLVYPCFCSRAQRASRLRRGAAVRRHLPEPDPCPDRGKEPDPFPGPAAAGAGGDHRL